MPEWIGDHKALLGLAATLSVVTFVGSLVAIPWVVARLPEDYFLEEKPQRLTWWTHHPALRWAGLVLKNIAGGVFIIAGVAMLVLPGQGLLTIVVGIMLCNFPGKYRLERWLAHRGPVMRALNWLRRRSGRPPFDSPDAAPTEREQT